MKAGHLVDEIASLANLTRAMRHCRRGKRNSRAYNRLLLHWPDRLQSLRRHLLWGSYEWLPYHKMKVFDPKERDILVAPFRDRITHQSICQVIGPLIDQQIPPSSYACRKGLGNRNAVLSLAKRVQTLGRQRYTIKLDIRRYFESINHEILLSMLSSFLRDEGLIQLLANLLASHGPHQSKGCGIPIGNVTSQHFANLYLAPLDRLAAEFHGLYYIRYMDDMVICGKERQRVFELCHHLMKEAKRLKLEIPREKTVFLGQDPIPFLGFVLDEHGIRPLSRNLRRHRRQLKRLRRQGGRLSQIAEIETSFSAWLQVESMQLSERGSRL